MPISTFSYGICLLGVKRSEEHTRIVLNPGHGFKIEPYDHLYYMAMSSEDILASFKKKKPEKNGLPPGLTGYGMCLPASFLNPNKIMGN